MKTDIEGLTFKAIPPRVGCITSKGQELVASI
jgi:hypothetical protein